MKFFKLGSVKSVKPTCACIVYFFIISNIMVA